MQRAISGNEAIELFDKGEGIDIVLMDVRIPDLDGIEVTKIFKKIRPDIPVIFQTAHALSFDIEKCLNAGGDEVLVKPIRHKELLMKMKLYLTKNSM